MLKSAVLALSLFFSANAFAEGLTITPSFINSLVVDANFDYKDTNGNDLTVWGPWIQNSYDIQCDVCGGGFILNNITVTAMCISSGETKAYGIPVPPEAVYSNHFTGAVYFSSLPACEPTQSSSTIYSFEIRAVGVSENSGIVLSGTNYHDAQ